MSKHIHIEDKVASCLRYEFHLDPPVDLGALLGNDDRMTAMGSIYPPLAIPIPEVGPCIVSAVGILHVIEYLPLGGVVSVAIRPGHVLKDVVLRQGDNLTVLATTDHLVLWIVSGQDGIFSVRARLVPDKEHLHAKIRQNLGDLPLREYLTRKMLFDPLEKDSQMVIWPEVMTLPEAAAFLRMGESTLRTRVAEGRIRRTPSKRFLRQDLEAYLHGGKPRRGRS